MFLMCPHVTESSESNVKSDIYIHAYIHTCIDIHFKTVWGGSFPHRTRRFQLCSLFPSISRLRFVAHLLFCFHNAISDSAFDSLRAGAGLRPIDSGSPQPRTCRERETISTQMVF